MDKQLEALEAGLQEYLRETARKNNTRGETPVPAELREGSQATAKQVEEAEQIYWENLLAKDVCQFTPGEMELLKAELLKYSLENR